MKLKMKDNEAEFKEFKQELRGLVGGGKGGKGKLSIPSKSKNKRSSISIASDKSKAKKKKASMSIVVVAKEAVAVVAPKKPTVVPKMSQRPVIKQKDYSIIVTKPPVIVPVVAIEKPEEPVVQVVVE